MSLRIDRRQFLKAAAITGGAIGAGIAWPRGHGTVANAISTRRCRLGGNTKFINTEESALGQTLSVQRIFKAWNEELFSPDVEASAALGRRLIISVFPATRDRGGVKRWAAIASGKFDSDIKSMALQLNDFAKKAYPRVGLCFHHEPENDRDGSLGPFHCGDESDFRAAFSHFFSFLSSQGVRNIRRTLILMSSSYNAGTASNYWPGDNYVDRIGVDCYNWFGSSNHPDASWRSFRQIIRGANSYSVEKGRIVWVCETGTLEDPNNPGRKAQWITDMGATIKTMPNVRALMYFEGGTNGWSLSTPPQGSSAARSAFASLLANSYFI